MEDEGLLEATSNQDDPGGLAQVKWRPSPSENGGFVKMEEPWPKLQGTIKKYSGCTVEMDRIRKWVIQLARGAIAV